jgi:hypothetical protein
VIAPAWLVRAALEGSAEASSPLAVGDPLVSWLYQPAVRSFRVHLYGDDNSFLQGSRAALFASDSSFTAFYPHYHRPTDTADKLDAAALARMGAGVLGIARALLRVPRGPAQEPDWFAAFGIVLGRPALLLLGLASLLPGLWLAGRAAGWRRTARIAQAGLGGALIWTNPVPALWVLLLPNLLAPWLRPGWITVVALAPAGALLALGGAAWHRGVASGLWLASWQIAALLLALVLAFAGRAGGGAKTAPLASGERT